MVNISLTITTNADNGHQPVEVEFDLYTLYHNQMASLLSKVKVKVNVDCIALCCGKWYIISFIVHEII